MSKIIVVLVVVVLAFAGLVDCSGLPGRSKDSGLVEKDNQLSATQNRIYGGREAIPGSWPSQVAIYGKYRIYEQLCGGSVLNDTFVLTAAHCCYLDGNPVTKMRIVAGVHNRAKKDHHWQERKVARCFIHPEYDGVKHFNDIALLELEYPLSINERVRPALLPRQGEELNMELESSYYATVIGWGATETNKSSVVLLEAQVPIEDPQLCSTIKRDYPRSICAGAAGIGPCFFDSGGPLMVQKKDKQWYVFGLTIHGPEVESPCGKGVIFAKTSSFIDWIKTYSCNSSWLEFQGCL